MSHPQHRAHRILDVVGRHYPGAYQRLDEWHRPEGREGLPQWPHSVYVPMSGSYAIVSNGRDHAVGPHNVGHISALAALSSWRMGKIVARFDADLAAALIDTPLNADLPATILQQLPAWCLYVGVGDVLGDQGIHGFWVHLDDDPEIGLELRLLLDMGADPEDALSPGSLIPIPIPLHHGSLMDCLAKLRGPASSRPEAAQAIANLAKPVLPLVLYLCSDPSQRDAEGLLANPEPTKTKRGLRLFPAPTVSYADIGMRIGAALRAAKSQSQASANDTSEARVTPHVRVAHWHTVLSGPRLDGDGGAIAPENRTRTLRWFPPILVGAEQIKDVGIDALPIAVRPVH